MYNALVNRHKLVTTVLVATLAMLVTAALGASGRQPALRSSGDAAACAACVPPQLPEVVVTAPRLRG